MLFNLPILSTTFTLAQNGNVVRGHPRMTRGIKTSSPACRVDLSCRSFNEDRSIAKTDSDSITFHYSLLVFTSFLCVLVAKIAQVKTCALKKNKKNYPHIPQALTKPPQRFFGQFSPKTRKF
jgi:hypothetical protein